MPNDPVLTELMAIVGAEGAPQIRISVSVHGTVLTGQLISQNAYLQKLATTLNKSESDQPAYKRIEEAIRADKTSLHLDHANVLSDAGSQAASTLWRIRISDIDGFAFPSPAPMGRPPQSSMRIEG